MKQALWKAIEAYRQSTSIEDQWRNRDALDTLINAALSLAEFDAAPVQAVVKDSLTTQEPTPLEVRLVDTLLGQAQEPFAPDWAGYRQGKADGIAEAQEQRKPLTDEQCQAVIDSMPTYDAWGRTDKEGDVNLHEFARAVEAANNIKEQP